MADPIQATQQAQEQLNANIDKVQGKGVDYVVNDKPKQEEPKSYARESDMNFNDLVFMKKYYPKEDTTKELEKAWDNVPLRTEEEISTLLDSKEDFNLNKRQVEQFDALRTQIKSLDRVKSLFDDDPVAIFNKYDVPVDSMLDEESRVLEGKKWSLVEFIQNSPYDGFKDFQKKGAGFIYDNINSIMDTVYGVQGDIDEHYSMVQNWFNPKKYSGDITMRFDIALKQTMDDYDDKEDIFDLVMSDNIEGINEKLKAMNGRSKYGIAPRTTSYLGKTLEVGATSLMFIGSATLDKDNIREITAGAGAGMTYYAMFGTNPATIGATPVSLPATVLTGMVTGQTVAFNRNLFKQYYSEAYIDMYQSGIKHELAKKLSYAVAGISLGVEQVSQVHNLGMGKLAKSLISKYTATELEKMSATTLRQAIGKEMSKVMGEKFAKLATKSGALKLAGNTAGETFEEIVQTADVIYARKYARSIQDDVSMKDLTDKEIQAIKDTAKYSIGVSFGMSGMHMAMGKVADSLTTTDTVMDDTKFNAQRSKEINELKIKLATLKEEQNKPKVEGESDSKPLLDSTGIDMENDKTSLEVRLAYENSIGEVSYADWRKEVSDIRQEAMALNPLKDPSEMTESELNDELGGVEGMSKSQMATKVKENRAKNILPQGFVKTINSIIIGRTKTANVVDFIDSVEGAVQAKRELEKKVDNKEELTEKEAQVLEIVKTLPDGDNLTESELEIQKDKILDLLELEEESSLREGISELSDETLEYSTGVKITDWGTRQDAIDEQVRRTRKLQDVDKVANLTIKHLHSVNKDVNIIKTQYDKSLYDLVKAGDLSEEQAKQMIIDSGMSVPEKAITKDVLSAISIAGLNHNGTIMLYQGHDATTVVEEMAELAHKKLLDDNNGWKEIVTEERLNWRIHLEEMLEDDNLSKRKRDAINEALVAEDTQTDTEWVSDRAVEWSITEGGLHKKLGLGMKAFLNAINAFKNFMIGKGLALRSYSKSGNMSTEMQEYLDTFMESNTVKNEGNVDAQLKVSTNKPMSIAEYAKEENLTDADIIENKYKTYLNMWAKNEIKLKKANIQNALSSTLKDKLFISSGYDKDLPISDFLKKRKYQLEEQLKALIYSKNEMIENNESVDSFGMSLEDRISSIESVEEMLKTVKSALDLDLDLTEKREELLEDLKYATDYSTGEDTIAGRIQHLIDDISKESIKIEEAQNNLKEAQETTKVIEDKVEELNEEDIEESVENTPVEEAKYEPIPFNPHDIDTHRENHVKKEMKKWASEHKEDREEIKRLKYLADSTPSSSIHKTTKVEEYETAKRKYEEERDAYKEELNDNFFEKDIVDPNIELKAKFDAKQAKLKEKKAKKKKPKASKKAPTVSHELLIDVNERIEKLGKIKDATTEMEALEIKSLWKEKKRLEQIIKYQEDANGLLQLAKAMDSVGVQVANGKKFAEDIIGSLLSGGSKKIAEQYKAYMQIAQDYINTQNDLMDARKNTDKLESDLAKANEKFVEAKANENEKELKLAREEVELIKGKLEKSRALHDSLEVTMLEERKTMDEAVGALRKQKKVMYDKIRNLKSRVGKDAIKISKAKELVREQELALSEANDTIKENTDKIESQAKEIGIKADKIEKMEEKAKDNLKELREIKADRRSNRTKKNELTRELDAMEAKFNKAKTKQARLEIANDAIKEVRRTLKEYEIPTQVLNSINYEAIKNKILKRENTKEEVAQFIDDAIDVAIERTETFMKNAEETKLMNKLKREAVMTRKNKQIDKIKKELSQTKVERRKARTEVTAKKNRITEVERQLTNSKAGYVAEKIARFEAEAKLARREKLLSKMTESTMNLTDMILKLRDLSQNWVRDKSTSADIINKVVIKWNALGENAKRGKEGQKLFSQAKEAILREIDNADRKEVVKQVDKLLNRKYYKKDSRGTKKGIMNPQMNEYVTEAKRIFNLSGKMFVAELNNAIKEAEVSGNFDKVNMLNKFGNPKGKNGFSSFQISALRYELDLQIKEALSNNNKKVQVRSIGVKNVSKIVSSDVLGNLDKFGNPLYTTPKGVKKLMSLFNSIHNMRSMLEFINNNLTQESYSSRWQQSIGRDINDMNNQLSKGLREKKNLIESMVKEIFGDDNKLIKQGSIKVDKTGIDINGVELSLSPLDAVSLRNWWLNDNSRKALVNTGFDAQQMEKLNYFLNSFGEGKYTQLADKILEYYDSYHVELDLVNQQLNNLKLVKEESFTPMKKVVLSKRQQTMQIEGFHDTVAGLFASSTVDRKDDKAKMDLDNIDAMQLLSKYTLEMESWRVKAPIMKDIRAILESKQVRDAIKRTHGSELNVLMTKKLNALETEDIKNSLRVGLYEGFMNNFVRSHMLLNIGSLPKQVTSFIGWAISMPMREWVGRTASYTYNPSRFMELIGEINEQSEFLTDRYESGSITEGIGNLHKSYSKLDATKKSMMSSVDKWGMIATTLGDKAGIMLGGVALYEHKKELYFKKFGDMEKAKRLAIGDFEMEARHLQQSGKNADTGLLQQGGSLARMFTVFMNSQLSLLRVGGLGLNNLVKGRGSKKQAGKEIFMTMFAMPMLFSIAGIGGSIFGNFVQGKEYDDDDDLMNLSSVLLSPVTSIGIPMVNDLMSTAVYGIAQLYDKDIKTPPYIGQGMLTGEFKYETSKFIKDIKNDEYYDAVWHFMEASDFATGIPAKRLHAVSDYFAGKED